MANILPWGFHRLADVADQKVTDQITRVREAVNQYIAFRSQENNAVLSTFVEVTTEIQAKFKLPGAMRLQPLTEQARPTPELYRETEYTVAWPLQRAGLALGQTYEQRAVMNISQFAGIMQAVADADLQWLREHALAALFYSGSGWFHDDKDDPAGELTIKGLANGDTQTYFSSSGTLATDNHYLAQTGDLVTATDPIPAMIEELREHPVNTGDTIILGSTADKAKYLALAAFYQQRDPNLTVGSGVTQFTGNAPGGQPLGEFIGYHLSGAFIYLWRGLPTNYLVAFTNGNDPKPIRQRERPEAVLRGFKPDDDRADYPFYETDYVRRAGFGAWNRVGAVVQQVNGGDTTYDVPTNYASPMP